MDFSMENKNNVHDNIFEFNAFFLVLIKGAAIDHAFKMGDFNARANDMHAYVTSTHVKTV